MILKYLGHVGDFISRLQFFHELASQKEGQLQNGGFASLVLELLGESQDFLTERRLRNTVPSSSFFSACKLPVGMHLVDVSLPLS